MKFKRNDENGNKLSGKQLNKFYYDEKLKAPGKRFIGLRSSDKKWRGCSKSCYPSGKFKEGKIIKDDAYCRKWFTLMNEKDCIAADSGLGPSVKKLLENPEDHYYEEEEDPKIDETKVNYPPSSRESYEQRIKRKLKKIKKAHTKFGKKNIEGAFGNLVNKNPGILSKHNAFRTDDGVFLSNLIQVSMEMQNIEEALDEEEREEDDKEFMRKLYNGEIEFDDPEEDDDDEEENDSETEEEEEETNIGRLLQMFKETEAELIDDYENSSQRSSQGTQTQ